MKMNIFAVAVPEEANSELPSVKFRISKTTNELVMALKEPEENEPEPEISETGTLVLTKTKMSFDSFDWLKIEDELNTIVVDNFIKLLSAINAEIVQTRPVVGISWIYCPKPDEHGKVSVEFAQGIFIEEDIETFFRAELAKTVELEFFEAI